MSEYNDTPLDDEARILAQRRRDAKREKRMARRGGDESGLNINSMMDMMTIILVFLIDSYGSSPIKVRHSPDLVVPPSESELSPEDTLQITITRKAIIVGDDTVAVVGKDGKINKADKRGGENSFYITKLFNKLQKEVDKSNQIATLQGKKYEGVVTIIADRTVPYRLVTEVMYTAGQAKLAKFKFAIIKYSRDNVIKKQKQKG